MATTSTSNIERVPRRSSLRTGIDTYAAAVVKIIGPVIDAVQGVVEERSRLVRVGRPRPAVALRAPGGGAARHRGDRDR